MADLSITITIPDEQVPRFLDGFRKQWGNPELTLEDLLPVLKANAIDQMKRVVQQQEINAARAAADEIGTLDIV